MEKKKLSASQKRQIKRKEAKVGRKSKRLKRMHCRHTTEDSVWKASGRTAKRKKIDSRKGEKRGSEIYRAEDEVC